MNPLLWIALVTAAIALSLWLPRWRLKRALAKPLPAAGLAVLEKNIPVSPRMPAALQEQLRRLVVQFLFQKKFVGCGGLEITDEMRYTIAGQACLLLLNRQTQVYPELDTILVYPTEFIVTRNEVGPGGAAGGRNPAHAYALHDYQVGQEVLLRVAQVEHLEHAWSGGDATT